MKISTDIKPNEKDEFNAAIDFAIEQGLKASTFLNSWRKGDTSEWPEFQTFKENRT